MSPILVPRSIPASSLRLGGWPGKRTPEYALSQTTFTLVANQAVLNRFHTADPLAVASVAFVVTTAAGSNDACDVGIYDTAGNRLAAAGATLAKLNAVGLRTVPLSVALPAGAYFVALSCGAVGTTAGVLAGANANSALVGQMFGSGDADMELSSKAASHPLPATLTGKTAGSSAPILAVRTI